MGNLTTFTLKTEPLTMNIQVPLHTLITESHLLTREEGARQVIQEVDTGLRVLASVRETLNGYNPFEQPTKWYNHVSDLRVISKVLPEVMIILTGTGEDPGDLWKKYFMDGKMQECKGTITYENFYHTMMT